MPQPTNQPNIPPRRRRARADSGMKARTMFCVAVFIIAGFGLLIYQLYALQLRDAELYRTEAVTQQMKDITLSALSRAISM